MSLSQSGFLVRFRPSGPWRPGPESGARDRVDRVYHSDSVYSAVSSAMAQLGHLEDWLQATAGESISQVRFSSCFPYQARTLFAPPPRNLWPPAASSKLRWSGARFVPLQVVEMLVAEKPLEEDRWRVDGLSGCLLASGKAGPGPYRVALRSAASVDRLGAGVSAHATACLEFASDAGLWMAVAFSSVEARAKWGNRIKGAVRLLADSGCGGERSRGWGRSETPEIAEGPLPELLLKKSAQEGETTQETAYWLLSLFSPAEDDKVDWHRGSYSVVTRSGRAESAAGWGERKKATRMVEEGSVLLAAGPLSGAARNVAPDGFAHPVFRAGFALAIPIPWKSSMRSGTLGQVTAKPEPTPVVAAAQELEIKAQAPMEPGSDAAETESIPAGSDVGAPKEPVAEAESSELEPAGLAEHADVEGPKDSGSEVEGLVEQALPPAGSESGGDAGEPDPIAAPDATSHEESGSGDPPEVLPPAGSESGGDAGEPESIAAPDAISPEESGSGAALEALPPAGSESVGDAGEPEPVAAPDPTSHEESGSGAALEVLPPAGSESGGDAGEPEPIAAPHATSHEESGSGAALEVLPPAGSESGGDAGEPESIAAPGATSHEEVLLPAAPPSVDEIPATEEPEPAKKPEGAE